MLVSIIHVIIKKLYTEYFYIFKNQQSILFLEEIGSYNLGQKVGDKFIKLSKIGFSMECFTADFLQFFNKKRQNLTFG